MDSENFVLGCVMILIIFFIIVCIGGILSDYSYGEKVGVVIDKIYYAPHGKTNERFLLKLEKEINGIKRNISIYVPEYIYKEYEIGDYYGGDE